jgi:putative transposase
LYLKESERPMFYQKQDDGIVLSEIREVINLRPSYGYKRVTAMINKNRLKLGLKPYNKKRVVRVMRMNGLTHPKPLIVRDHAGTGKVMTLRSNTRWCSDCFEIKCFNGEKVFVIFVLDTCDREVIWYLAKREPILAVDVQSIMIESVEKRFNETRAPRLIQFLSDRGSIYRAIETRSLAATLNLQSCFTMAYSPESNGMAESLVKTIKRDYVYMNDCDTADSVLKMLPEWFKDYNEVAPHSALGMLSPFEYIQKVS